MQNEPLISVIVPVYKVEKYLDRCVESIVDQTYKNLEIILVDDGSPDNCPAMCDAWAAKDNRVRVIHKENGGLSSARNAGLYLMSGMYVSFVDSDDYIDSNMIADLYSTINGYDSAFVFCGAQWEQDSYCIIDLPGSKSYCSWQDFMLELSTNRGVCYCSVCNKLYSSSLWNNLQFPEGKIHEDEAVALGIAIKSSHIFAIDKACYHYVQHDDSIMHVDVGLNSLDIFDTLYNRMNYFLEHGEQDLADATALQFLVCTKKLYVQSYLQNKESIHFEMRRRLKKYKKSYLCKETLDYCKSVKEKLHLLLFCYAPLAYAMICKILFK